MIRSLGLFVTERCNLACPYCFARGRSGRSVDPALAKEAIELFVAQPGARELGITFWGGEPLAAFDLLAELVRFSRQEAGRRGVRLRLALPTNLTLLSGERLRFLRAQRVQLSLSLDGDAPSQALRPFPGGKSSFDAVCAGLALLRRELGPGAPLPAVRLTVSPLTAPELRHNVGWLLHQGLRQIAVAPVAEAPWSDEALATLEQQQRRLIALFLARLEQPDPLLLPAWDRLLARRERFRRGERGGARVSCGAGQTMLALDLDGRFHPCHRFVFYVREAGATAFALPPLGTVADGLPDAGALERASEALRGGDGDPCAGCAHGVDDPPCALCPALNLRLGGTLERVHGRLCALAALERRVVQELERRAAGLPAFSRHLERVLALYSAPPLLPRLPGPGAPDAEQALERAAARAEQLLAALERGRRRPS